MRSKYFTYMYIHNCIMPKTELSFYTHYRVPYIEELFSFSCDDKEGFIEFNGYYYVADEDDTYADQYQKKIPTIEHMNVLVLSDDPPTIINVPMNLPKPNDQSSPRSSILADMAATGTCQHTIYKQLSNDHYIIQIYKRDKIQDTSVFSTIDDGDEELNVCFFPTHRQRLYFRVLAKNPTSDQIKELIPVYK